MLLLGTLLLSIPVPAVSAAPPDSYDGLTRFQGWAWRKSLGNEGTSAPPTNPFQDAKLFVAAESTARQQVIEWQSSRPHDVPFIEKIAAAPQADWFGDWTGDVRAAVDRTVSRAEQDDALAVLVTYNIPMRDCGSYSHGGAASPDAYRRRCCRRWP